MLPASLIHKSHLRIIWIYYLHLQQFLKIAELWLMLLMQLSWLLNRVDIEFSLWKTQNLFKIYGSTKFSSTERGKAGECVHALPERYLRSHRSALLPLGSYHIRCKLSGTCFAEYRWLPLLPSRVSHGKVCHDRAHVRKMCFLNLWFSCNMLMKPQEDVMKVKEFDTCFPRPLLNI